MAETAARRRPARRLRLATLALVLAGLLFGCQVGGAAPDSSFYNPLLALNGADPWLQFYEGNYYLTATQWSSIKMWKAPTLAGLSAAEPVTIWSDPTPSRCCNVWAPEFHLLDGPDGPRWYVYYTAGTDATLDNQRMHVLESSGADPLGPYSYKGRIFDPSSDGWAIDASVLTMDDGQLYLLFSSWVGPDQSLFIAPMSNPWTISGPRVLISKPTYDWERATANVNEGPEVLRHGGKTFVVYSASACWGPDYALGMLTHTGGDVLSPESWSKHPQPVFARSDENGVYAPGHNGFFTSPDGKESWIVYHANASASDGCTGERTTRAQKFTWNADGTPNFGAPLSLDTPVAPPSGEEAAPPAPAATVTYTLVSKAGDTCVGLPAGASGAAAQLQPLACDDGPGQQWGLDYLGNGYYRLRNQASGEALSVTGGPEAKDDGAAVGVASWSHAASQQWRLLTVADGWLRAEARHSGKVLGVGGCGAGGVAPLAQSGPQRDSSCQQFRLQPAGEVKIVSANSERVLAVEGGSSADGARVAQWGEADGPGQRWRFAHQENGYYQIVAGHSDKCLTAHGSPGANGAPIGQQPCGAASGQQWRVEPLNDGMLRLVARDSGKVLDVSNCRIGDGAAIQQWGWLDNMCQRFRLAAP